jgi:hypothetical protein
MATCWPTAPATSAPAVASLAMACRPLRAAAYSDAVWYRLFRLQPYRFVSFRTRNQDLWCVCLFLGQNLGSQPVGFMAQFDDWDLGMVKGGNLGKRFSFLGLSVVLWFWNLEGHKSWWEFCLQQNCGVHSDCDRIIVTYNASMCIFNW